jgi:4-phosphopantoate--beta-alanine ligase
VNRLEIPKTHPRYDNLMQRERLVQFYYKGIVTISGLISHGRGEAFDYLLGEKSQPFSILAEKVSLAKVLGSRSPVISVNGNVTALADDAIIDVAKKYGIKVEANIFHWSQGRIEKIVDHFRDKGLEILGKNQTERIPGLEHDRGRCERNGIYAADTVIVPLEDGDRVEALRRMGKFVIAIDLNPLSRSARAANVTIVDDVKRTFENILKLNPDENKNEINEFDNDKNLKEAMSFIAHRLETLDWKLEL